MAFSPDGRLLATASGDDTARLWDPATGDCLRTLTGHTGASAVWRSARTGGCSPPPATTTRRGCGTRPPATACAPSPATPTGGVAFSPDGRLLATASGDKTARLWDPATGDCRRTLTGHTDEVFTGVAFSPDGRLLATASGDKTARLWDPATGDRLRTLTGHTGMVRGVAFSPDGRLLATAGGDKTARLWDPATGECLRTLTGHTAGLGVAFSPDGRLLATASSDKTARLWDPATGERLRTLTGHTGRVWGWRSARTGGCSPPAAATRRRGCGTDLNPPVPDSRGNCCYPGRRPVIMVAAPSRWDQNMARFRLNTSGVLLQARRARKNPNP